MKRKLTVLMVDDDEDDCMLVKEAFSDICLVTELRCLKDGAEMMDYLLHRGPYQEEESFPKPGLILLDLNMPRMDGRQALKMLKSQPALRSIPVIILTTSKEEQDILNAYDSGASSFITKPLTFNGLVDAMKEVKRYWFDIVRLPPPCSLACP